MYEESCILHSQHSIDVLIHDVTLLHDEIFTHGEKRGSSADSIIVIIIVIDLYCGIIHSDQ